MRFDQLPSRLGLYAEVLDETWPLVEDKGTNHSVKN
jgi:hypothetical protein